MIDEVASIVFRRVSPYTGAVERRTVDVCWLSPWRPLIAEAQREAERYGMQIETVNGATP